MFVSQIHHAETHDRRWIIRRLACWAVFAPLALAGCKSEAKRESESSKPGAPQLIAEKYRHLEGLVVDAKLLELSETLIDCKDLDLERRNKDGLRLLDVAASRNQPLSAAALVVAGSNIWAVDRNGDSVMHFAARANAAETIVELKRFAPNLKAQNKRGLTAADVAEQSRFFACVTLLKG